MPFIPAVAVHLHKLRIGRIQVSSILSGGYIVVSTTVQDDSPAGEFPAMAGQKDDS